MTGNSFIRRYTDVAGTKLYEGIHSDTTYDADGLVTSTDIGAAGDYTINGVLGDSQNLDAFVTVTGAADESASTFVITGTDRFGNYQREEFVGSSTAGDTAVSTKRFGTITSIATEQDAGVVSIGTTRSLGNGTAAIVSSTDIAAAGAYTLNGAFKDYTDLGAVIEFVSAADDSGRTFTIVGKGMLGQDLSETLTGANTSTATSLNVYKSITSIHADASTAGAVVIQARTAYDSFVARGNLELSTSTGTPVKIDTVAQDHIVGLAAGPSTSNGADDTLQKIGAQSQSSEVQTIAQDLSVETLSNANKALELIDDAIVTVSSFRSSFGAIENRLDAAINNLSTLKVNTQASQSRIQDADFASETTSLTKSQILAQAATSMLAQANASKQNLLALLQG